MNRDGDFSASTKKNAIERQRGVCAFCGIPLKTPWSKGDFVGHAHHLRPLAHGGFDSPDNCVYLCEGHHMLLGHGLAPFGVDKQGGSSDTWVKLTKEDFEFWGEFR